PDRQTDWRATCQNCFSKSLAERHRRALGWECASGVARPCDRSEPATSEKIAERMPRPRNSWVIWGSALGLIEEAVEFAAGGIEGALLLFRAVVDQWSAVGPNDIMNKFLGRDLSLSRGVVEIA